MIPSKTDVLILGGGFGGMNAAMTLDRKVRRGLRADVTLISRTNFYLFTPLLAEVAASLVGPRHVVNPIRRLVRRVRFIEGAVRALDPERRRVEFTDENGRTRTLEYEHGLLALGGVTEFFGIEGLAEHALTLKTLGDAVRIRNDAIGLFERAAWLTPEERRPLLTYVVAGGGLNGVEVAGELHDFLLKTLEDYPTIDPRELRMVLVEMTDRLAQEVPAEAAEWARRNLESRGIEVWLGARVTGYAGGRLRVADGRDVETASVIWTAGVRPSPLIRQVDVEWVEGDHRLPVNEYLQVRGYETLWAVGDCALVPDPREGFQPPTAQHAVRQGRRVARNIVASLTGRKLAAHRYRGIGMLATLGRHRGLGRVLGLRLTGFPAWFAWRTYYLLALPGWDRRLRVAFDWFLDFIFPPDIVELKVEPLQTGQEAARETAPPRERTAAS
ncbi:MAG: NAD(P)/FAD-dependent oxidoreductase [Gemmatimonadota bacterium]